MFPDLAPLLWHSFGTIIVLLQVTFLSSSLSIVLYVHDQSFVEEPLNTPLPLQKKKCFSQPFSTIQQLKHNWVLSYLNYGLM